MSQHLCGECGEDTKGEGWRSLLTDGVYLCWDAEACAERKKRTEIKHWQDRALEAEAGWKRVEKKLEIAREALTGWTSKKTGESHRLCTLRRRASAPIRGAGERGRWDVR